MTEARAPYGTAQADWIGDDTLDALRAEYAPGGTASRALAELAARRDQDLWWPTAVSVLLQVVQSPEIECLLTERQTAAVQRVKDGYGDS